MFEKLTPRQARTLVRILRVAILDSQQADRALATGIAADFGMSAATKQKLLSARPGSLAGVRVDLTWVLGTLRRERPEIS